MTAGEADHLCGVMCKEMDSVQGGAPKRLQPTSKINILEVGTVLPVPLGTFLGVPLPLALHGPASLLPICKTRIRGIPLAADPARSLFV